MNSSVIQRPRNLGALVGQTARQWRRAVDKRLQPFGLTEATWLPLLHLARAARPMRQKDLAASLALDSSSVVRLLDALEQGGLVERREGDNDRRAKTITLTQLGRETVAQVEVISAQVRDEVLSGLSTEELDITFRVLDHICAKLGPSEEAGLD
ncbi:MarR family winged helix-turn-helix transcriptional regulator [Rhodoligotrophos ferricapiens]|uniref:MarR family winged helix-turn-helix transcriptional regulator n=1 Tax=Rhodoligotrophos ferricapiens TaxID=3069264 RepID=UPI00315DBF72